jgi:hypothetical protein
VNVQICVLQRGWVVVGDFSQDGAQCFVRNGYVVRRWGTSEGLGELAARGPLKDTKLDPLPETTFHELTVVARLKCDSVWEAKCAGK